MTKTRVRGEQALRKAIGVAKQQVAEARAAVLAQARIVDALAGDPRSNDAKQVLAVLTSTEEAVERQLDRLETELLLLPSSRAKRT